jgi:cyclopropane-fatty-acyl-phospholipid synthase
VNHDSQIHYDNSVDLYRAFLDPYMKYTSGLFRDGADSLDSAIVNMLNKHCSFALSFEQPRILEIGPGWGSLLKRLTEILPKKLQYTAINPSVVQNDFIRMEVNPSVEIHETSFENFTGAANSFDVIYLIGSFCHMRQKDKCLAKLATLLNPNGVIVIEDTFFVSDEALQLHGARPETKYVQEEVFGFAEIQSLPLFLNVASQTALGIDSLLEHSTDYAKTIEIWIERLAKLDASAFPQVSSYIKYMKIGQRGLGYTISNHLVTLKKLRSRREKA